MDPFIGEIRIFSFPFAPRGWALCNGSLLPISGPYEALFAVIGTTFGGNGTTNFALPDLRGRAAVSPGAAVTPGLSGGEEVHVLQVSEMPPHNHAALASSQAATLKSPVGAMWAQAAASIYSPSSDGAMSPSAIGPAGSGMGHPNMQPFSVCTFCIAVQGLLTSHN